MTQWGNIHQVWQQLWQNIATWGLPVTDDAKCELKAGVDKEENTSRKIRVRCQTVINSYTATVTCHVIPTSTVYWCLYKDIYRHVCTCGDIKMNRYTSAKTDAQKSACWSWRQRIEQYGVFAVFLTCQVNFDDVFCVSVPPLFPHFLWGQLYHSGRRGNRSMATNFLKFVFCSFSILHICHWYSLYLIKRFHRSSFWPHWRLLRTLTWLYPQYVLYLLKRCKNIVWVDWLFFSLQHLWSVVRCDF